MAKNPTINVAGEVRFISGNDELRANEMRVVMTSPFGQLTHLVLSDDQARNLSERITRKLNTKDEKFL